MKISVRSHMKSFKLQTHGANLSIYRKMQPIIPLQLHIVRSEFRANISWNGFRFRIAWILMDSFSFLLLKCRSWSCDVIANLQHWHIFKLIRHRCINTLFRHLYGVIFDRVLLFGLFVSYLLTVLFGFCTLFDLPQSEISMKTVCHASQIYSFIDAKWAERYLSNKQMHKTYANSMQLKLKKQNETKTDASTTMCNAYSSCQKQTQFMIKLFFLFVESSPLEERRKNIEKFSRSYRPNAYGFF